jgi:hypothetical protein
MTREEWLWMQASLSVMAAAAQAMRRELLAERAPQAHAAPVPPVRR